MPPRRPVEISRAEGSTLTRLTYTDADFDAVVTALQRLLGAPFLLGAIQTTANHEKRLRRIVPELRNMLGPSGRPDATTPTAVSKTPGRDIDADATEAPAPSNEPVRDSAEPVFQHPSGNVRLANWASGAGHTPDPND